MRTASILFSVGGPEGDRVLAARASGLCGHHRVHVLARHRDIAIYVLRASDGKPRTQICIHGKASALDSGAPESLVQHASITIADNAYGYAVEYCDSGGQRSGPPCFTIVSRLINRRTVAATALDPTTPRSQVTRMAIAKNGAFAWISCHRAGTTAGEPDPITQPGCLTTGRRHYVYALPADAIGRATPVLLTSGRGIAPRTLSVGTHRVTWRAGKRLRSAPIPPSNSTPAEASLRK